LCYASDPIFFVENIHLICRHLWTKCGALALRYDSRLIPGRLSILERKLPTERLFFSSANFEAVDVDDLYSELVTHNTY